MSALPPKSVTIPIRVVVRGGGAPDGERIRDAIAESAGNQLTRAVDLLDESGNPWRPTVGTFDVTFTGRARDLPDEQQRDLYAYVGDGLGNAAGNAQKQRRGAQKAKKKDDAKRKKKKREAAPAMKSILAWTEFDDDRPSTLQASFEECADTWMLMNATSHFPTTFAIVFRVRGVAALQLRIYDGGQLVCARGLTTVSFEASGEAKSEAASFEPDLFNLYLELEPDGLAKWRASQTAKLSKKMGEDAGLVGAVVTDAEAAKRKPKKSADDVILEHTAGWEDGIFYRVRIGDGGIYPFLNKYYPKLRAVTRIDVIALYKNVLVEAGDAEEEEEDGGGGDDDSGLPDLAGGGGDGGGGGADKGQGLGSDVTAPEGQGVGKGGKGIVIAPAYKVGGSIYPVLPPDPMSNPTVFTCERYEDELSVNEIPTGGEEMRRLIAEIAARLEMEPCEWPAHFCIQAARMVRARTSQIHTRFQIDANGEFTQELRVGVVDEGGFEFRALDSVGVQYLQHLAGTIPKIRGLINLVTAHTFKYTDFAPHHWFGRVADEAFHACGLIWLVTNQFMMQQLLDASRRGVEQRLGNAEYYRTFAAVCRTHLADQVEMLVLRDALGKFESIVGDRTGDDAYVTMREYVKIDMSLKRNFGGEVNLLQAMVLGDMAEDAQLATRLADATGYVFFRGIEHEVHDAGAIVEAECGGWLIRSTDGELYSKAELDHLIMLRQQVIVSIDPLINQLLSRLQTAVRPLIEDPSAIPAFLDKMLGDMLAKNAEISRKNRADYEYAFEHGQIHRANRDAPPAVAIRETRVWGWALQGVHALAHNHVGVRFEQDSFYNAAVDKLLGQEYYWRSFVEDMIFVFGIALTVVCPPLGAAVSFIGNMALGIEAYQKAKEQESIYGAFIDPEQVLSYAEIQIDLFLAKLQIGLSFLELLPGAGKGVKALTGLGKKAAKEGVKTGAKTGLRKLAKELVMEELEKIAKLSAESFVKALALELAEEVVEDKIVDALLGPVIEDYIKDIQREIAEGRAP